MRVDCIKDILEEFDQLGLRSEITISMDSEQNEATITIDVHNEEHGGYGTFVYEVYKLADEFTYQLVNMECDGYQPDGSEASYEEEHCKFCKQRNSCGPYGCLLKP